MTNNPALEQLKRQALSLSRRYMTNAEAILKQAGTQDNGLYIDAKYVRIACAAAYCALLIALDCIFILRNAEPWPKDKRKHIGYYRDRAGAIDPLLRELLNAAYNALHLLGYYDGNLSIQIIRAGFDIVYQLIDYLDGTPISAATAPVAPLVANTDTNILPPYVLSPAECRKVDRHCRQIARRAIRRHYVATFQNFCRYRLRYMLHNLFHRRPHQPSLGSAWRSALRSLLP